MGNTGSLLFIVLLMLSSCKNQAQVLIKDSDNSIHQIYGQWEYANHLWHQYGRYSEKEHLNFFKKTILKIDRDKTYFKNINFLDTCFFSSVDIKESTYFKDNTEIDEWYGTGEKVLLSSKEVGPLPFYYTKKELINLKSIKIKGCYDRSPSLFYLKQDTLIVESLIGITLFMTKVAFAKKSFVGSGKSTEELVLTGEETSLKLSYDFLAEADQLVIEDEKGNELFSTGMKVTKGIKESEISLSGVTKLVFKVKSSKSSSKWKFTAKLY